MSKIGFPASTVAIGALTSLATNEEFFLQLANDRPMDATVLRQLAQDDPRANDNGTATLTLKPWSESGD